jgi:hypothetical protein
MHNFFAPTYLLTIAEKYLVKEELNRNAVDGRKFERVRQTWDALPRFKEPYCTPSSVAEQMLDLLLCEAQASAVLREGVVIFVFLFGQFVLSPFLIGQ